MSKSARNTANETPPEDKVLASPTRKFFVEMLTRDIDLMDAIMDLVDNCIDGVHRENKGVVKAKLYREYHGPLKVDHSCGIVT